MDTLDLGAIRQDWGKPAAKLSMREKPLTLGGTVYERGVGTHARCAIHVALDGKAKRFQAVAGLDDNAGGNGSIRFRAYSADKLLLETPVMGQGAEPATIDLDLSGLTELTLIVDDAGDGVNYDHASWGDARFIVEGAAPRIVAAPEEAKVMRTPKPPASPRINGPLVYGVRPGSPFLYRIPCTGERPIVFSAESLPEGLALDSQTGIISGTVTDRTKRNHDITLAAENGAGKDLRALRVVVGDTLALTPPMGWNHWYAHYDRITDPMMREAADILVSSGMADVGYQYVNIDDCWPNREEHADPKRVGPFRDAEGNVLCNGYFPDMKAMTDYIHGLGLKAGIYTSPGPKTCAGFAGAYQHEEQDARQFAAWGFDFLKYDWCSYGEIAKDKSLDELKKPYILMGDILKTLDRDIVLNLCQYGMGDVWTWGKEVGGQSWRTAGDLGFELQRYYGVAQRNAEHHEFAGPGAWNDPDYLLLGYVGAASEMGEPVACTLTGSEQYSYMSLWCLMAAPLFYSGDMTRLDEFTLNVLCNPEVIAINQDPLGKQGYPVVTKGDTAVWTKPLHDGSMAVGLFNLAEIPQEVSVKWGEIGISGLQIVRDLWRQTDVGEFAEGFSTRLGRHDVALLRVGP
ncbi:MAG: NPCBM/NEW2 domain-containing protein [Candidatus Hydrogenedentes bacterium]|nr:NPCBM/NEW2 domain-containing protein [Candidatus Hydrogenedentota bacterium]